ncbi:MAG: hypothetical protein HZB56_05940 [Deltaproteobacteria bacterium]|nr:hypothetical protein [Deltaproteobacteria bacterium]
MPVRSIERSHTGVRVVVEGQLVPEDVVPVREELRSAAAGFPVEIDLRGAGDCQAHALLMLTQVLAEARARTSYRGLTVFDRRLLRYLGRDEGAGDATPA